MPENLVSWGLKLMYDKKKINKIKAKDKEKRQGKKMKER